MGVTLRSFILAVVLIIAAAFVYQISTMPADLQDDSLLEQYPSFTATNFTADNFAPDGRLLHHLEAKNVVFYQQRKLLNLQNPQGIYYSYQEEQGRLTAQPWALSAAKGRIVLNQEAELTGEVRLIPQFPSADITEATTSYLHFDMAENVISTPERISIRGPNFVNYGTGMKALLNDKKIYLGDPHARYEFN